MVSKIYSAPTNFKAPVLVTTSILLSVLMKGGDGWGEGVTLTSKCLEIIINKLDKGKMNMTFAL